MKRARKPSGSGRGERFPCLPGIIPAAGESLYDGGLLHTVIGNEQCFRIEFQHQLFQILNIMIFEQVEVDER